MIVVCETVLRRVCVWGSSVLFFVSALKQFHRKIHVIASFLCVLLCEIDVSRGDICTSSVDLFPSSCCSSPCALAGASQASAPRPGGGPVLVLSNSSRSDMNQSPLVVFPEDGPFSEAALRFIASVLRGNAHQD